MSIENTASSMLRPTIMGESSRSLGNLVKLPREIRDEIYRHVLKGHYCFKDLSGEMRSNTQKPDLALFSVSKATYDESSSMLYSESVFRFGFDRITEKFNPTMYPPEPTVRRMMNIELVFDCCGCWHSWYSDTLKALNIGRILRDSLSVTSEFEPLETGERLLSRLSKELEAFKSFRTVTLKVNAEKYPSTISDDEESTYITRVVKQE